MSHIKLALAKKVLVEEFKQILSQLNATQLPKLKGWKLMIDVRPKGRLGQCRWAKQEIGISAWLLELNDPHHKEIVDTLRHEVAHVLAGAGTKHGAIWRRFARAVGARPTACCNTTRAGLVTPKSKSKIIGTCDNCGEKFGRLRRPIKPRCCTKCSKKLMIAGYTKNEAFQKSRISWLGV